jgi:5-methylcytosine-specific restriction enzyme A
VTLRPCLDCGTPSPGPRCSEHTIDTKPTAHKRGYDWQWTKLSRRARRLQPFCTDCGSTEDLQTDHTREAWQRKAAGKTIRFQDIDVVCADCNRARGAARGSAVTRGVAPSAVKPDSAGRRNPRYTLLGGVCEGQPSRNPESQYLGTGAFRISRLMIAVSDHFLPNIHDEVLGLSTTGSRHFQDATSQNFVGVVIAMFAVWKVRVAHCERHVWSLP